MPQKVLKSELEGIVNYFFGLDNYVIDIARHAAEKKRYGEFMEEFKEYIKSKDNYLGYIPPKARRYLGFPAVERAIDFLLKCYLSLEIEPPKDMKVRE